MLTVTLSTDGSCKGNPGPGGYCGILRCKGARKTVEGFVPHSTNSRAELLAITESLSSLTCPCKVELETDSTYAITCINSLDKWHAEGWKGKKNTEILQKLYEIKSIGHVITCKHVKGHSGNPDNEECDRRAKAQIELNLLKGA